MTDDDEEPRSYRQRVIDRLTRGQGDDTIELEFNPPVEPLPEGLTLCWALVNVTRNVGAYYRPRTLH